MNSKVNEREKELEKNGNDSQNLKDQIQNLMDKIKEQAQQMNDKEVSNN